jgi:hypothetical protein
MSADGLDSPGPGSPSEMSNATGDRVDAGTDRLITLSDAWWRSRSPC